MTNRVAFITGASSGIGYATAFAFAREGMHVAVTARRADRLAQLEQAVHALPAPHGEILCITADVRVGAAMQQAVDDTIARFGHLDILVANAGIGHRGSLIDATWDDLNILLHTNIDGVLHTIRAAVPAMRKNGAGHILIVSSVAAYAPGPYMAVYAATKAFVSSLAQSLRFELAADNIWVTDMRVGRTQTEFNEKRLGEGQRQSSGGLSSMNVERVAAAIVRASKRRQKIAVLRPIDRLIILASIIAPDMIGRMVVRQYK
jgi:short-subunit dehydrogenase